MTQSDLEMIKHLPQLAGLSSMHSAIESSWSVEKSVAQLKRVHYVLKRLAEIFCERLPQEPVYELKTLFSHHAYLCSEQVELLRKRVTEMREPPLGLDVIPHPGLELLLDELVAVPETIDFANVCYGTLLPSFVAALSELQQAAHPVADAPSIRIAKLIQFEMAELVATGDTIIAAFEHSDRQSDQQFAADANTCLMAAGGISGNQTTSNELPNPVYSADYKFNSAPQRDGRFKDPHNAGVNAEAFLYDPQFSAQDKTLMLYFKRLRELDVPEMMVSILVELRDEESWPFHHEMLRQLWDEARHAMLGEVGFCSLGIDWTEIPINFTWSKTLNSQLDARQRHGVLFFIEQGLMPKTGKKFEWQIGLDSGDRLAAMIQDFDWADEVLHAQIGRRWYTPRFDSLQAALDYGDQCWSKVMSQWEQVRAEGLTEHRNWWPDLYSTACKAWGKQPAQNALQFNESYQLQRADLKQFSTGKKNETT